MAQPARVLPEPGAALIKEVSLSLFGEVPDGLVVSGLLQGAEFQHARSLGEVARRAERLAVDEDGGAAQRVRAAMVSVKADG